MLWWDPPECEAAQEALKLGNPAEAARLLLGIKPPQHRKVHSLLVQVGRRLVQQAAQQFTEKAFEAAQASLDLAARCAALDGDALALRQKIAEALEPKRRQEALQRQQEAQKREQEARKREQEDWACKQIAHAQQLAKEGKLHEALDLLMSLARHDWEPPLRDKLERARYEVEQRLRGFQRHVEACKKCLEDGQPEAAYRHWEKARAILPDDPQLTVLASTIARAPSTIRQPAGHAVPINDRAQRLVFDGRALVVSSGQVCLGTPRADGVQVPLQGPLHSRHAVLLRDRHGWQLTACRDGHGKACSVLVGGQKVEGSCRLADGCVVQLGSGGCSFRFRLPVPSSTTAVLEHEPGSRPCVWTGARLLGCVVLLDQELLVRSSLPAHLVVPELPCKQLVLRWQQKRLIWEVEGGSARVEVPGQTLELAGAQLVLPCRLVIEPQMDEAEWLGRAFAGREPAGELALEFTDPDAQST